MSKSADAFRTISEVADELAVPKHVLRFWEGKFPQIRPMKRGGGRRYYRPGDMDLLRGIRQLLHSEGYTIKGVQRILREQGIDAVKEFAHAAPAGAQRTGRKGQRAAVAPAVSRPAEMPRPVPVQPAAAADAKTVMKGLIAELEVCRRLLTAGERAPAAASPARRSSRG